MKDELQTPKSEHLPLPSTRKLKSINPPSKKPHHQQQKTTKPNAASSGFTPITVEDSIEKISLAEADQSIVVDPPVSDDIESARGSLISEAFEFYDDQASIESYIASFNQHISPSFITTPLSSKSPDATTPLSCITTAETTPPSSTFKITTDAVIHEATIEESKSVKPEPLVKHLRESIIQVLNSSDIEPNYKKLLDALIKTVIEQFCTSHEDKGSVVERFSKKVKFVLLSYLLVMLLGSVGFFLLSDAQNSYHGPPPT
ncbi:uncharacterized protein LOC143547108 [Bidens hawaiensis]|uniref:uncharacterized protein LOC143547108 n=1 Tax=Bidens hawaiensis TaxID=980011 RepID=UPI00404A52A3